MTSVPAVAVVVPVRNGGALVERCLSGVAAESQAIGAELIVVDDGSTDDTLDVAARYATVLRTERPSGPYVARNLGWRSTAAEVLVFTDVRCRPREGWLRRLLEGMEDSQVAIVGGDTLFEDGPRLASRFLHATQPFTAEVCIAHSILPYVPTCNMAIRRSVLEALGGFPEVRSGGDTRVSWNVQVRGLGAVGFIPEALMDARGRDSTVEVARQWWRYGAEAPYIRSEYANDVLGAARAPRGEVPVRRSVPRSRWRPMVKVAALLVTAAYRAGFVTSGVRIRWAFSRRPAGGPEQEAS